jgi:hypothetical protein
MPKRSPTIFSWKIIEAVKSRKLDGTVKSFRCRARKSDGMKAYFPVRRNDLGCSATPQMARFGSLSPAARRDFYEAVKIIALDLLFG